MNLTTIQLFRLAKELTGSTDIETILNAVIKISNFDNNQLLTIEQLSRPDLYINDPIQGLIKTDLFDYQLSTLENILNTTDNKIILSPRQAGKTIFLAYLAYKLSLKSNQTIVIMTNRECQGIEILNSIKLMLSSNPLRHSMLGLIEYNRTKIRFDNGSKIMVRPATANSCRGLSISYLLVDEAAYISYKGLQDMLSATLPTLVAGGRIIMASTPYKKEGPFYESVISGNYDIIKWDNVYSQEELYKFEQTMPKENFKHEFLNQFI